MHCIHCGTALADGVTTCTQCNKVLSAAPPFATTTPATNAFVERAKLAGKAAYQSARVFIPRPLSGIGESLGRFPNPDQSLYAGIAYCVFLMLSVLFLCWRAPANKFGGGLNFEMAMKILGTGAVPFVSIVGVLLVIQALFKGSRDWKAAVFAGGASTLPFAAWAIVSTIVGMANFEVIGFLGLFAIFWTGFLVYSACTSAIGLTEAKSAFATPVVIALSAWLCKVICSAWIGMLLV